MPALAHIIRRRHNRKRRRRKQARRSSIWLYIVLGGPGLLLLTPVLGAVGLSLWLYAGAASYFPLPERTVAPGDGVAVTRFYERGGARVIHSVTDPLGADRPWLRLGDLPAYAVDASLQIDDPDFLSTPASFSATDALAQVLRYIIGAPLAADDSLTSRLARDALLPLARSSGLDDDLLELVLAAESQRRFTAEELLEWRLNSSYYGRDAFGIEAAAQVYLGLSARELSLAQAAFLAPLAEEPRLNPLDNPQRARERGADLLFALLDAGRIDRAQFDIASAEVVAISKPAGGDPARDRAFLAFARRQAEGILARQGLDGERLLARGGLTIRTSLDLDLQGAAECLIDAHLAELAGGRSRATVPDARTCAAGRWPLDQAGQTPSAPDSISLALIDVANGQLLALAGEATAARHQPAIVLRPFVYMDAFLRREYTPASMVLDLPHAYPGAAADLIYTPANPDGRYHGPLNLRDAMAAGLVAPAAQVAGAAGLRSALQLAGALGFGGLDVAGPELALLERGGAVSVLDSAYAYSVLAAAGEMRGLPTVPTADNRRARDPVAILRIEDADGRLLWAYEGGDERAYRTAIIEPSLAYIVNDILSDGDARRRVLGLSDAILELAPAAAVIDGQSADGRDSWTVGYTADMVLAVRAGREDGKPMSLDAYERTASAPVWRGLLEYALDKRAALAGSWPAPPGIEEYLVCEISGALPPTTDHCPTRREIVPRGTQLRRDDRWRTVEINRATAQLATVNTPDELRESVAYFVPPDDIMAWWEANDRPLPPSTYSPDGIVAQVKPAQLTAPADYAYLGASVAISGQINRAGAGSWLLEYGAEANPDRWHTIAEGQTLGADGAFSATWETALLSGIHTLRLRVTFDDGGAAADSKLLTFDNTPPSLRLNTSAGETRIPYRAGLVVSLLADARDNLTLDRVEFYHAGELVALDRDWPYGADVAVAAPGAVTFRALAFDQVGNQAASELALLITANAAN